MEPLSPARILAQVAVVSLLMVMAIVRPTPRLQLLAFGMLAMILYGMIQDQFTARLSLSYFTVAHPRLMASNEPTWHAVAWGFLGGWPSGLGLGLTISLTSTLGPWPSLHLRDLYRPVLILLGSMAVVVSITGFAAWTNYELLGVELTRISADVPPAEHRGFFTVACAHLAAYASGLLLVGLLAIWIIRERQQRANEYHSPAWSHDITKPIE